MNMLLHGISHADIRQEDTIWHPQHKVESNELRRYNQGAALRKLNLTPEGKEWLTDRQLDDLRDQLLRHPSRTLLEANEAVQALLFKAQVDTNEVTGEACQPFGQRTNNIMLWNWFYWIIDDPAPGRSRTRFGL